MLSEDDNAARHRAKQAAKELKDAARKRKIKRDKEKEAAKNLMIL